MNPFAGSWYALFTMAQREAAVGEALRALAPQDVFIPWLRQAGSAPRLLFPNYVFVRLEECGPETVERLRGLEGVRRLVGPDVHRPSRVEDHDIAVLQELCAVREGAKAPELGPLPTPGRMARIIEGPMAGAVGRLVRRQGPERVVLAFTMPILAGAYELALPHSAVEVLPLEDPRPRHRGGRRAARGRGRESGMGNRE